MIQQPAIAPLRRVAFLALCALILAIEWLVAVPALHTCTHPQALTLAIAFDCAVVPALLSYGLFLRPQKRSVLRALPLVVLGLTVAFLILPPEYRASVCALRFGLAPLELGVFLSALWGVRKGIGKLRGLNADATANLDFESRLNALLPADTAPALRLLTGELVIWHYALFAWRTPTPAADDTTFSTVGESAGLIPVVLLFTLFEGVAEHLLLWHWNPRVDLVLVALTIYGVLWIVADLNAQRLRPLRLGETALEIRTGLRWEITVPYASIVEVRPVSSHARRRPAGYVNAVGFGTPNLRVHLSAPLPARGPFGLLRQARYIALRVDEQERFRAALGTRMALPSDSASGN